MPSERVVVGAAGDDETSRATARTLRDAGHEVVFVGGRQTPEHLARTAVAEDATRIVLHADDEAAARVRDLCAELGAADVVVELRV
jgi:methylmalonyl-CoA mutase C-terminal domain/subunit